MDRERQRARLFLAFAPTLVASMRASSGFRELDWPCLRVLHLLSLVDRLTVDDLASHLGLRASGVSKLAKKLRTAGYVSMSPCTELPNRCPKPRPNGMPCGKHRMQVIEDAGRELIAEWERPYLAELLRTEQQQWVSLGPKMSYLHDPSKPGRVAASIKRRRAA